MRSDAHTTVCGVIGHPVRHSLSPDMHNAGYEQLGLNFIYVAWEVADVGAALQGVRGLGIRGLSVTIPHKQAVMDHLDEIEPLAAKIGSVNTVVNDNGRLRGFSTDGYGALRAVREAGVQLEGQSVTILGNGGSARALGATLLDECNLKRLVIVGRNRQRVQGLVDELSRGTGAPVMGGLFDDEETGQLVRDGVLTINTTSVGMAPHATASPLDPQWMTSGMAVFDIVYTPKQTLLLQQARQRGAQVIFGQEMFIYQAVHQFEAFTGHAAPVAVMRAVVEARLG